jgi:hypothetical protein
MDHRSVLDYLFAETDVRVFESYSKLGAELCEFTNTNELAAAFPLGTDRHGHGSAILLQLWSPSVMRTLDIVRLSLNPEACGGHTFRYCIEGGGLMQLYLGGICAEAVTPSHFGHQSETRAVNWDVDEGVDWRALKTLSNRIQYRLRKKLAVARASRRPVLPQAYSLARSGYALKLAAEATWVCELETDDRRT